MVLVSRRIRALLVNENIGGHATVHHPLRANKNTGGPPTVPHPLGATPAARDDMDVRIVDVPPPGFWRKAVAVALPGLGRLDADLGPGRVQLGRAPGGGRGVA